MFDARNPLLVDKYGRPHFVIRGGSGEGEPENDKPSEPQGQTDRPTEQKSEPKGPTVADIERLQASLDKEREARRQSDRRAKENEAFRAKAQELEEASKSETEKAVEAARREGEQSATKRVNSRMVAAETKALAAELNFRDPAIAVRLLDLSDVSVSDDGEPDTGAIRKLLEELAKASDYLLKDKAPVRPSGDVGQGPRPSPAPQVAPGLGRMRAAYAESATK